MAQHDNGRRPGGTQSGAWQQGQQREQHDNADGQQDQSSGGRYGSQYGGQQGAHGGQGGSSGQHDQYGDNRHQQGDNWRDRQGPASGGGRPAMEERGRPWNDRSGQGSFGGQASDNDYGNRGITESGNFGNYNGGRNDSYGPASGQQRNGQRDQHPGSYRHGYDARSDSSGGAPSGGGDWNAQRAWRDEQRNRGNPGQAPTYGQSAADNYQGGRGGQANPGSQDGYGDNGYQGNFQQGQRGQAYHDPDYHQWRSEQLSRLDRDYDDWRQHRYQRFADEFDSWRSSRAGSQAGGGQGSSRPQGQGDPSGTQADGSKQDGTHASDKGKSGDISSTSSSSTSAKK